MRCNIQQQISLQASHVGQDTAPSAVIQSSRSSFTANATHPFSLESPPKAQGNGGAETQQPGSCAKSWPVIDDIARQRQKLQHQKKITAAKVAVAAPLTRPQNSAAETITKKNLTQPLRVGDGGRGFDSYLIASAERGALPRRI